MFAVLKRELKSYFSTPIGYVFLGLFLVIAGFFFSYGNLFSQSSYYNAFLSNVLFIFLFVTPILTMRLLTDEKRNRTDQLLLTSPLRLSSIVLGKFLAAVAVFVLALAVTVLYAVVVATYGDLQTSEVVSGYLGFVLLGSCFIAIGLFVSATTENQVSAAVITFGALLFVWLMGIIQQSLPNTETSGMVFAVLIAAAAVTLVVVSTKNVLLSAAVGVLGAGIIALLYFTSRDVFPGLISRVLSWFSLLARYESFSMGILKLEDIVYYLSFIGAFLFLTVRLIEKRRWS